MFSVRGVKLRYLALVLGLIALAAGVYLSFFAYQGYVKGTGEIVSVDKQAGVDSDSEDYEVTVRFQADGKEYTGKLNNYSPSYKVGKQIGIRYDPQDPSRVTGDSALSFYLIGVGILILLVVIVSWVRTNKSNKAAKAQQELSNSVAYAPSQPGPERQLYFLTDLGTPKYGHRIEDRNRRVLYEAKMTKFTLTAPFGFDFIDHEHNKTVPHAVGHEEATEWDNSLLFDNHYTFTFDGEYIWKHLKRNGITVESTLRKGATLLGTVYKIFRDGNLIATAEATSQYVHEEDAEAHKIAGAIPVKGFYRIRTTETNLDLLFVTMLAFARTEASDSKGGNFQTLKNTLQGK